MGSFWWRVAWDRCSSEVERRFFVDALLEAIRGESGAVTLHAITPWSGDGLFPAAPASDEDREDSASQQAAQPRASSSGTASGLHEASVAFILSLAECARAVTDAEAPGGRTQVSLI